MNKNLIEYNGQRVKKKEYLTMRQIEILLKYLYLGKIVTVAKDENIKADKIARIKNSALRIIRCSYSKSYRQGLKFQGENVLEYMAERSNIGIEELTAIFDGYISIGLCSANKKYWELIKKKDDVPTAVELLDFLYEKFKIEIMA